MWTKNRDMTQLQKLILYPLLGLLAGCWYGPPETHHRIENSARKPNAYTSVAVVYSQVLKPPKGLATFPNGGISKLVSSEFTVSLLAPMSGSAKEIFKQQVPRKVQHAFRAGFLGWERDSIFLQLSGCPENECWGEYVNHIYYRIKESGGARQVEQIPAAVKFKGQSQAPMPRERNYLRLGNTAIEISMTTDVERTSQVIYTLNTKTGIIEAVTE